MEKTKCPLCSSDEVKLLNNVNLQELLLLYRKMLEKDLSYLFKKELQYYECHNCNLRFFNPLITGDEQFYKGLQEFDWYYLEDKSEYKFSASYINRNHRVLDVGCGKAAFAKYVKEKYACFVGLDFSENAKNIAAKQNIDIFNMSIQDYAFEYPESVDVVTSFQVLEHVEQPREFLESKIKVLKQGGIMIIAVPNEDSFLSDVTNGILNMPPHHVTRWGKKTLQFIAKEFNLELLEVYEENVQPIHESFYWMTRFESFLLNTKLLDLSIKRRVVKKASSILARPVRFFNVVSNAKGHTILAIYRKK